MPNTCIITAIWTISNWSIQLIDKCQCSALITGQLFPTMTEQFINRSHPNLLQQQSNPKRLSWSSLTSWSTLTPLSSPLLLLWWWRWRGWWFKWYQLSKPTFIIIVQMDDGDLLFRWRVFFIFLQRPNVPSTWDSLKRADGYLLRWFI